MRRTLVVSMIAALFAVGPLAAQAGRITGSVTSAEGNRPLSGATVSVGGSQAQAVTGPDGRYTINGVNPGTVQVTASTLGHASVTRSVSVAAGATATADFQLAPAALALEGLVAIGYGEVQERNRTGVVEAVTEEEFNTGRVVSPEQLIQGKVAGVQVIDSGEPGGGIGLRVRGGTSVTSSNEPLFVVDGVPLEPGGGVTVGRNALNFLNPADIESITVLKDASATAIYGSRGANGVVLVKTRSGARGPRVTYSNSFSTSAVTAEPNLLSADQFRAAVQQYAPENLNRIGNAATDWRDAVQRDATGQEHTLALSGVRDDLGYRLSLGYLDQEGVVRGSLTERLSAAANYTDRLFDDNLNVRATLRGARTSDQFTPGAVIGSATVFAPTQPVQGSGGTYFQWDDNLAPINPVAQLDAIREDATTYRGIGNIEGEYRFPFFPDLAATVRAGFDITDASRTNFTPASLRPSNEPNARNGSISKRNLTGTKTVLDAFANYRRAFDRIESEMDITAGYSYERFDSDTAFFEARGLNSDLLGPAGIPTALDLRQSIEVDESRLASFFARANYSFRDRYLFSASVRRDGSSRFGPDNQWGTFPSAALAWRVSEEPFMERFPVVSDLKLRASWGVNGNQAFGNYQWVSSYLSGNGQAQVQFGNDFVSTIRPSAVDPNIKWEETTSYNLGLDYALFDGRVSGSVEYYDKDTDDLIFNVPVAAGTNLSNFVTTNIGSVNNRGFEFSINADVFNGGERGFRWNAGFNAATNRNRLLRINSAAGSEQILVGGISGGVGNNIQVLQPGHPVYSFFVYRHKRDSNGNPVYADLNNDGTIDEKDLYEDLNGDGNVNQNDRAPFENPAPNWILGHTSNMGYRSFDLGFTLRAHLGNYVYNNVASNQGHYSILRGNFPGNLHESVLENGFVNPQYFSDVYVEDASFLRMDNLTLGYTFSGIRAVSQMRVYGTVQNVFTLTGYSGVDPLGGGNLNNGIDNNVYPRSRTFSLGVSVGF